GWRFRGDLPRCSNGRTPDCSAASGSTPRRGERNSLEQLLDRLLRLVGFHACEVDRAFAQLFLDVADRAACDPLRLRLLDEGTHLRREPARPFGFGADLLRAQL